MRALKFAVEAFYETSCMAYKVITKVPVKKQVNWKSIRRNFPKKYKTMDDIRTAAILYSKMKTFFNQGFIYFRSKFYLWQR